MKNHSALHHEPVRPNRQHGVAALLIVLLVGLSLTTIAMGAMSYIRGAQDSQMSLHAQTQAEIRASTGVQALTGFLQNQTQSVISTIASGTITPAGSGSPAASPVTFQANTACPSSGNVSKPNYCFNVVARSGNATSALKTVFSGGSQIIGNANLPGSIFAAGLVVDGNATLTGLSPNVAIQVGGAGYPVNNQGSQVYLTNITSSTYNHTQFIQPGDLRPNSNYIYYKSGTNAACAKNNLSGISSETPCDSTSKGYATYNSASNSWAINSNNLPVGVLWFDGDVNVTLTKNIDLTNTIIATGSINTIIPNGFKGSLNLYAPNFYKTYASSDIPEKTCGAANYPTQLCSGGSFKDMTQFPANIANILFLAGANLTLDGSNNVTLNLFGNMLNATSNGGTGSSSGKFTGTGTINITGNIVNASENPNDKTVMLGNITINLANTVSGNNSIPTYQYNYTLKYVQYL